MLGFVVQNYSEAIGLLGSFASQKQHTLASKAVFEGKLGLQKCVLIISGKGKVNAAMATQLIIDNYPKLDLIINFGLATAINKKLILGGSYLVKRVIQTDYNSSDRDDTLGLMDEYETKLPLIANKYTELLKNDAITIHLATQDTYPSKDNAKVLNDLDIDAVDMEAGSIMQVCKHNRKPLVCFKAINQAINQDTPQNSKYTDVALSHLLTAVEDLIGLI